jgi:hypothetical protein
MREVLENRRAHEVFEIEHDGQRYTVGVGHFPSGKPAEVFINSPMVGTAADINARDGAILLSLLMQHGVDISAVAHSLTRNSDGKPSGPIGQIATMLGDAQ